MGTLQPPTCKSRLKEDQEKFNLTWYIGVTLLIFLTLLTVLYINYDLENVIVSIGGVVLALVCLSILFFTGKYWIVGILVVVIGSILFQFSIYTISNPDRIIDTLWIIIYSLYAFHMLNIYWSLGILIFNLVALMLHQAILGPYNVFYKAVADLEIDGKIDYYVNISFAIICISFLLIIISKAQKKEVN